QVLARRYQPSDPSPLDAVAELLHEGRHYFRTGISLVVGERVERQAGRGPAHSGAGTRSELSQPIKLAGRALGVIEVESGRPGAFSQEDRILLKEVAERLARFLTGRGKYVVRRARDAATARAGAAGGPERHQPSSERATAPRAAAAGETPRS
ncbi:MAG TPA: GAF domain-containing protein, partial [Terriglobales bacterium]|nr:GAF domain-containing protein [Terriglobales bacterium]